MAKNTKKTSAKSTKSTVSRFATAASKAANKASEWTPVNEETLSPQDRALIKSATVVQYKTSSGPVLKCKIAFKDGTLAEFPLQRHWEFERGDTLNIKSLTLCNLQDADGNLKEDNNGDVVEYIYGDVE